MSYPQTSMELLYGWPKLICMKALSWKACAWTWSTIHKDVCKIAVFGSSSLFMECGWWFHSFCDAFSTKEGGKKRNPIATLLMDQRQAYWFHGTSRDLSLVFRLYHSLSSGAKKIKKNLMPTWTKALIGYSNPGAARTLGSISLYSRPLFSIFGFITRLFISTQMLYFPFWLEKYFFDQDLHYCRGMDKPQICVKKLWRHLSPAFERLSLIIHLLRLPTRFWNVSIFLFA